VNSFWLTPANAPTMSSTCLMKVEAIEAEDGGVEVIVDEDDDLELELGDDPLEKVRMEPRVTGES
jgi:hypothetical protein